LPDFDDELSFEGIEPFFLVIVQVTGWAAFLVKGVFQDEEGAAILRSYLEIYDADAQPPVFPETIFPGDDMDRWRDAPRYYVRRCVHCGSFLARLMLASSETI
jgi:hypothetical protein